MSHLMMNYPQVFHIHRSTHFDPELKLQKLDIRTDNEFIKLPGFAPSRKMTG